MSVVGFKITEEKMPLNHSTEKEKNIRHIGHYSSSYSMKKNQVGIHLLLVELCEKFTLFEVVCNMIPFCTVQLAYHNYQPAILNLCFIGTSIITPVFVGWFADVCVERKKLVYMCLFLHFLGNALLSVVVSPLRNFYIGSHHMINNIPKKKTRLFYVALLTICLGTGGIRAIVCPLGAYSLQEHASQKQMSFFNWFYWIRNLSATVVLLGRSYIQHSGAWALVSLIPFMSTLMALITLHMVHYNLIYQPEKFSIISYRFVPSTVRGNLTNFFILFNGFVYFMGELLVEFVYLISEGNWFPNTLNKGNLESFFFFLASLTLLNTLGFWSVSQRYCILNHFNAQNINGSNLEETLLLREKSLKFYGSTQEFSSSIDLWETAL
ncbi:solute carrier family 15 member 5 [Phyllostomus discolor]|uniref:Solute carrier family 15 member 5 n=1 Tax=Phyllostomus discolor TaxID=89673 RepID=A0A834B3A3_9CHIR|nr:solute carrier family 15 member 5 [Phyllostomus discolor]